MVVDQVTLNSNSDTEFIFAKVRYLPDGGKLPFESCSLAKARGCKQEVIDVDSGEYGPSFGLSEVKAVFAFDLDESKANHAFVHRLVPYTRALGETI